MSIKYIQIFIDILRRKKKSLDLIIKNNNLQISKNNFEHVILNIEGINNTVIIENLKTDVGKITLNIYGDNNSVIIKDGFKLAGQLNITIGQKHPFFGKTNNCTFFIDKNTSVESMQYMTYNSNTYCNIGEECMVANNVMILNTDAHPIFNKDTREIINKVKGIEIGKHSWIGLGATILKNSIVPENSIIGCRAVFAGRALNRSFCAFAGSPAQVVKENVDWDSNGAKYGYIENV